MNIGLDIDNVISDFDKTLLEEFLIEDKNKRNNGIINKYSKSITNGMFDWTTEEVEKFFCDKCEEIAKKLDLKENAQYYINKMLENGDNVYLITHRVYPHYNNPFEVTKNWLKSKNINYTKLIISKTTNKTYECIENNIDIMFDDSVNNVNQMMNGGINCFLFKTKYGDNPIPNMKTVNNWDELYNEVIKLKGEKINEKIFNS